MYADRIEQLREEQFHDSGRKGGPFRVGISLCKEPKFYRGLRVHVDAFGHKFTINKGA